MRDSIRAQDILSDLCATAGLGSSTGCMKYEFGNVRIVRSSRELSLYTPVQCLDGPVKPRVSPPIPVSPCFLLVAFRPIDRRTTGTRGVREGGPKISRQAAINNIYVIASSELLFWCW